MSRPSSGSAASVERASEHPSAAAIVAAAAERKIDALPMTSSIRRHGKGILGTVGENRVALGDESSLDRTRRRR